MPEKIIKLLKMIKESLWYNEERDNIIIIPEDDFTKNKLSVEDVKIGLETLIREKIIENYYIRDRIHHHYPTNYEDKIKYIENDIPYSGIYSEAVLGTPLYFIEIKNETKLLKYIKENQDLSQEKKEVEFDPLNGVLSYNKETYKIQSDLKSALMKMLWKWRKEIQTDQNGKEKVMIKGMMWPKDSLAKNIGQDQKKILEAIKSLNKIFRSKKFPLKIALIKGIQLIVQS